MLLRMPSRSRHLAVACVVAPLTFAAVAGCGSSASGNSSSGNTAAGDETEIPSPSSCPSPPVSSADFPTNPSATLPRPPSATAPEEVPVSVQGVTLLRFTTPLPLSESVAFLLAKYPKAGYRLLQGDSEGHEADAPFVKGNLHGTTRLSGTAECTTTWLVAVTSGKATLDKIPQLEHHDSDNGDNDSGDND
jgi:hypothetical protein